MTRANLTPLDSKVASSKIAKNRSVSANSVSAKRVAASKVVVSKVAVSKADDKSSFWTMSGGRSLPPLVIFAL
jgi:hypothetical protein